MAQDDLHLEPGTWAQHNKFELGKILIVKKLEDGFYMGRYLINNGKSNSTIYQEFASWELNPYEEKETPVLGFIGGWE